MIQTITEELSNCNFTEDQSCVDRSLSVRRTTCYPKHMVRAVDFQPVDAYFIISRQLPTANIALITPQVCELLEITPGQLRGWLSRGQFPQRDGELNDKTPLWFLKTIIKYVQDAPGGRLGYPVG